MSLIKFSMTDQIYSSSSNSEIELEHISNLNPNLIDNTEDVCICTFNVSRIVCSWYKLQSLWYISSRKFSEHIHAYIK